MKLLFSKGAWFDFGRETGIREERERIVALLEKHPSADDYCEKCWAAPYDAHIIRLIKGEK